MIALADPRRCTTMRSEPNVRLEQLRLSGPAGTNVGQFLLGPLRLIVSAGGGWDHVSVSHATRLPTWDEMDRIKQLCFRDDEIVMQLHVNDDRQIDLVHTCLPLWRPQRPEEIAAVRTRWEADGERWLYGDLQASDPIPLPPREFV